jgi:hypothetical protein
LVGRIKDRLFGHRAYFLEIGGPAFKCACWRLPLAFIGRLGKTLVSKDFKLNGGR